GRRRRGVRGAAAGAGAPVQPGALRTSAGHHADPARPHLGDDPRGRSAAVQRVLQEPRPVRGRGPGQRGGLVAMVPEGLVLLTSLAFAMGAIRLARRRVLVQELAAIEGLARVDVLCIDKTGTLTRPGMRLIQTEVVGGWPDERIAEVVA